MENTKAFMKAIETTDFAIHGGILVWLLLRVYENYTWDNIIPLIFFYIWVFVYHFIFYKIFYKFDKAEKQLKDLIPELEKNKKEIKELTEKLHKKERELKDLIAKNLKKKKEEL